jgi:hypothetical protein
MQKIQRLGAGECSATAVAINRKYPIAIVRLVTSTWSTTISRVAHSSLLWLEWGGCDVTKLFRELLLIADLEVRLSKRLFQRRSRKEAAFILNLCWCAHSSLI